MKYLIRIAIGFILVFCFSQLHAENSRNTKSFIGISPGINHYGYFTGDIFFGFYPSAIDQSIEVNTGYAHFTNRTKFDNFDKIVYASHGLFLEANFFTKSNFFWGVRLAVDGNFIDKNSQSEYTSAIGKKPPLFFIGKTFLGNIGVNFPLSNKIDLRLTGQAGFHNYKILTGWQIGTSSDPVPEQFRNTHAKELHFKMMGNLKGALCIRF